MESSEPDASAGNIWDLRAAIGRVEMSSSAVWVACMVALFGSMTWIPDLVGVRSVTGMEVWMKLDSSPGFCKKCAVAPVSATRGF